VNQSYPVFGGLF